MAHNDPVLIELDVAPGLEQIAWKEISSVIGGNHVKNPQMSDGAICFFFEGKLQNLMQLRTVEAVYLLRTYDIPRPKALLGDQNFRQVVQDIETVFSVSGRQDFSTMYLNAAGSGSSVMQRIKSEIAKAANLTIAEDAGDLLLRIRKRKNKWEVLTRLTPRPLATRSWRVCDYEGALNAPLASAMTMLTNATAEDCIVNLMCGSGTLMIESLVRDKAINTVYGVDNYPAALNCAARNLDTAGCSHRSVLINADVETKLPFRLEFASVLLADFPFGNLVGTHAQNVETYPRVLQEAARISQPNARFVLITHEVNLILSVLRTQEQWILKDQIRVSQRGLTPIICLLERSI